jgi:TonB family protein
MIRRSAGACAGLLLLVTADVAGLVPEPPPPVDMTPKNRACDLATPEGVDAWYAFVVGTDSAQKAPPWTELADQVTTTPSSVPALLGLARCYATFFLNSKKSSQFREASELLKRAAGLLRDAEQSARPPGGPTDNLGRAQSRARAGVDVPGTKKTKDELPIYPADALRDHVQGLVLVDVVIDKRGSVKDPLIVGSIPALDKAALDAVRHWRYDPTLVNGQPTEVVRLLPLAFSSYGTTATAVHGIDLARFYFARGLPADAARVLDQTAAEMRDEAVAAASDPTETDTDRLRAVAYEANSKALTRPPTLLKQLEPRYTSLAMQAKIQGDVELRVVISDAGIITTVMVARSLDPRGLDLEAVKAAKGWTFKPAIGPDGTPVPVVATIILSFRLH